LRRRRRSTLRRAIASTPRLRLGSLAKASLVSIYKRAIFGYQFVMSGRGGADPSGTEST
jgi:hypothetical protein